MAFLIDPAAFPRQQQPGPDQIPVDPSILQARIERLRAAGAQAGHAALVVFAQGARQLSGTSTHGNLRYLLDWFSGGGTATMIVPMDGEPVVVVPGPSDVGDMRERAPWIVDQRCEPSGNHGRLVRVALDERGIRGQVGLIGAGELMHGVYAELTAPTPDDRWSFSRVDVLLDEQRMVKDEIGLARMRRAAAICDVIFDQLAAALAGQARPVWQLQAIANAVGQLEGAEFVWNWMVGAPRPDRTRRRPEENTRVVQPGDCVITGLYLIYGGYYGHALRMFTVGEPDESHQRTWQAVFDAQSAAAALLTPGSSARAPGLAADAELFRHFPEARETDRVRFRSSHFIGLDYSEYPTSKTIAQPDTASYLGGLSSALVDLPMQADMTIELHPNICPPGVGLGALGDIFRVTRGGGERLTTFPSEICVVRPG
ncbi:MAG: M24 family metallopeptidase [Chloroflexi bacterium]|nr:M24 family metallopeptidase [Chloroflexota bacterium]